MTTLENDAEFVRKAIVNMAASAAGAHIGGALSCCDMMLVLFRQIMQIRPEEPDWPDRDYFILSKGHAAPALYATLARCGFIDDNELESFAQSGSRLAGHPKPNLPGVEFGTGSLGHGLALGAGVCMYLKAKRKHNRVYVILGDGELQEGSNWEAAQVAGRYNLSNLTVLIDCNHLQINGPTDDWMPKRALENRWESYGWKANRIDGHSHSQIATSVRAAVADNSAPVALIADTIKGKGVAFMENNKKSHHVALSDKLYKRAMVSVSSKTTTEVA